MQVKSTVRIDPAKLKRISLAQAKALAETAEALHTEIVQAQVMPRDMGNLQNESTFVDDSRVERGTASIVSNTPYARRLYYHPEYDFSTEENPNARGKWFEPWMKGGEYEDFARKAYKEFLKREIGR